MANIVLGKVKFVNKGNYIETSTYTKGDIVSYGGRNFIYKNNTPKSNSPIIIPTLTGIVTSVGINTTSIVVTFTGFNPLEKLPYFLTDNTPDYNSDYGYLSPRLGQRVYTKYFDENTGISSIGSVTSNTIELKLTNVGLNTSVITNVPVTIGPRRLATGYDIAINESDWDVYSDGYVFKGDWNESTVYLPGDIVVKRNSSYVCGIGNSNCDPLFDYHGSWNLFSRGDDLMPSDRILTFVNNQPFGWKGHPFISGPTWGENTWRGNIPWSSALGIGSTSPHAWRWNPGSVKNHMPYRGSEGFINGLGIMISDSGTPLHQYSQLDATHIDPQEQDIPYNTDFLTNDQPQLGNQPADKVTFYPRIVQSLHGTNLLRIYLLNNGTVNVAGVGSFGYWGQGNDDTTVTNACYSIPRTMFKNRSIVKLAISNSSSYDLDAHIIALDEHGEIHLWGRNEVGQCGISSDNHNPDVFNSGNGALDDSRCLTIHSMNKDEYFNGNRVVDIWAGHRSSYALTEDGTLWGWGSNLYGQLGYPTNTGHRATDRSRSPKAIPIDWSQYAGIQKVIIASCETVDFLVILDGQGQIWNVGYNAFGQLGRNNTTNDNNTSSLTRMTGWTGLSGNIVNVWADIDNSTTAHIWFRTTNGKLYGMGYNAHYNLTDSTTTNRSLPVEILGPKGSLSNIVTVTSGGRTGGVTQLFLDDQGYVYSTGWNNHGEGGVGQVGNVANNLVRYQSVGIASTTAQRASAYVMHSPYYISNPGNNLPYTGAKCIDIFASGYQDATSAHTPRSFTMFDNGELLTRGRNYDWGWAFFRGDIYGSVPIHNFGG
jgi:alpha-tubulin suppressor-like RCC1 family protein